MKCEDISKIMVDYLAGELDEASSNAFLAHLESCDSCTREFDALSRDWILTAEAFTSKKNIALTPERKEKLIIAFTGAQSEEQNTVAEKDISFPAEEGAPEGLDKRNLFLRIAALFLLSAIIVYIYIGFRNPGQQEFDNDKQSFPNVLTEDVTLETTGQRISDITSADTESDSAIICSEYDELREEQAMTENKKLKGQPVEKALEHELTRALLNRSIDQKSESYPGPLMAAYDKAEHKEIEMLAISSYYPATTKSDTATPAKRSDAAATNTDVDNDSYARKKEEKKVVMHQSMHADNIPVIPVAPVTVSALRKDAVSEKNAKKSRTQSGTPGEENFSALAQENLAVAETSLNDSADIKENVAETSFFTDSFAFKLKIPKEDEKRLSGLFYLKTAIIASPFAKDEYIVGVFLFPLDKSRLKNLDFELDIPEPAGMVSEYVQRNEYGGREVSVLTFSVPGGKLDKPVRIKAQVNGKEIVLGSLSVNDVIGDVSNAPHLVQLGIASAYGTDIKKENRAMLLIIIRNIMNKYYPNGNIELEKLLKNLE